MGGIAGLPPDYRPCGQSGDYPVGQIYQQQVDCEHRPAMLKPEIPRAAHRQEDDIQRQHRREEIQKTEEVQPIPGDLYKEPERDTPQPRPEERPVYIRRFHGDRGLYPECGAKSQLKQDAAEKDHGQSTYNPRRETDCHPLYQGQILCHHVQTLLILIMPHMSAVPRVVAHRRPNHVWIWTHMSLSN